MAEEEEGDYHKGAHAEPHQGENNEANLRGQGHEPIRHEPGKESETTLVKCGTSKGPFVARLHRDWAPNGYDRAKVLFEKGYYDGSHFFRVVKNFLVQFGISYTEDKPLRQFASTPIQDDPQMDPPKAFHRGTMSYAGSGPNSRTSQLFISYGDNPGLGKELWETPFGEVIEGMDNIAELYSYGDMPPWGKGPVQNKIRQDPNYIPNEFPLLDKFTSCTVQVEEPDNPEGEELEVRAADDADDVSKSGKEETTEETEETEQPGPTDDAEEHVRKSPERTGGFKGRAKALKGRAQAAVADFKNDPKASFMSILDMEIRELMQVGAVVSGLIVLFLVLVNMTRRKKKKRHKQ